MVAVAVPVETSFASYVFSAWLLGWVAAVECMTGKEAAGCCCCLVEVAPVEAAASGGSSATAAFKAT